MIRRGTDGVIRCEGCPDVELPDEPAAVRHLAGEHPDTWAAARSLDVQLVEGRQARREAARMARRRSRRHQGR